MAAYCGSLDGPLEPILAKMGIYLARCPWIGRLIDAVNLILEAV
jgi:hypothetical protein